MTTPEQSTLGKEVAYTEHYDPSQLFPIARAPARAAIGMPDALPFFGADIWNGGRLGLTGGGKGANDRNGWAITPGPDW